MPSGAPFAQPQRPQQRPHYVPFSAVQDHPSKASSTPTRPTRPSSGLHSASPSTPFALPSNNVEETPLASANATRRLSHGSPSAYDRFNEVDWIIDLSSRIGNALQSPSRAAAAASPSSSSQALVRSRSRVRLPRPSRDFRELQRRVQLDQGSSSTSTALDTSLDSTTPLVSEDLDPSAIHWAQHAQQDFERRRADLQTSRQGVLRHLQDDRIDSETNGHDVNDSVEQAVDPAVERSMLTARSLQELMRSGGLQSQDDDQQDAEFSNLLASAEALPAAAAAQLGPSSLFEAHRASDGSLDIESILQQRARMAAIEDHNQAGPSESAASMLDLSRAAPKPLKRPVIQVLGGAQSLDASEAGQAADTASRSSDNGSSQSSTDSDASSSSKDSEEAASDHREQAVEESLQVPSLDTQPRIPTPMDQIAIVDGVFQIIPAQSHLEGDQALDGTEDERVDDASDANQSDDADTSDDDDLDGEEDEEADSGDEQSHDSEHDHASHPTSQRYHDGFGGVGTRDLLYEGPTGDADEPIVLSDSDDDDDDQDAGKDDASSDHGRDSEEEDEDEEEAEDELDQDSIDSEGSKQDMAVLPQLNHALQQHAPVRKEAVEEQQEQQGSDAQQQDAALIERSDVIRDHAVDAERSGLDRHQPGGHGRGTNEAEDDQRAASGLQDIPTREPSGAGGDGMPDSEIEPEEVDEDLRWSDVEADQSDDAASAHAGDAAQLAPADAAFRAIQGSQAMPGFVSAAQIFADIQAAAAAADAESTAHDRQPDGVVNEDAGRIDPQLLAQFAGAERAEDEHLPSSTDATTGAAVAEPEPSNSQIEAYIFDAFTRQDASSDTHNSVDEHQIEVDEPSLAAPEAETDVDGAAAEQSDPPTESQPLPQEDAAPREGSADQDVPQAEKEGEAMAKISNDAAAEDESSAIPDQDEVQESEADQHIDTVPDALAADGDADEPSVNDEGDNLAPTRQEEHEEAPASPTSPVDTAERMDVIVETTMPKLTRVESTDVLEADVEDNSEEEAIIDEATVEIGSVSALLPIAATASSESDAFETSSIAHVPTDVPMPAVAQDANRSMLEDGSRPRISVQAQVEDEEGILSGDLADRDTSVERQDGPEAVATPIDNQKDDDQQLSDAEHDAERAILVATPAASKDAGHEPQDAPLASEQDVQLPEEKSLSEKDPGSDGKGHLDAVAGGSVTSITVTQPETSEPKEEDQDAGVTLPIPVNARTPTRVPPSPASSDRRSTSSFTPSANRQGNRHLHGAAKRSFFAQVTEAASGLASNLTAPLRAIPSLLPINERRAEETPEEPAASEATVAAEVGVKDDDKEAGQQQSSRPGKAGEATSSPMTTRSHCICRKLRLSKVEGAPVFIVPGCSINYEQARKEGADDLGPIDESLSDDWITVDPDFIPNDLHHMLSRIIGLQFLNEGICVEPDSTAAELVYPSYDLDEELFPPLGEDQTRQIGGSDGKAEAEEQVPSAKEKPAEVDAKDQATAATADAEVIDDDAQQQDAATPSRPTRRSTRHRRTSSAASTSSPHRSPRHPDPKSPNADYLPDEERRRLLKDRHPPASVAGNASIASLEQQVKDEEAEAVDGETKILAGMEDEDADTQAASATMASSSPQAKRKRGRARRSAAPSTQDTSTAQDGVKTEEGDAELAPEPQPKKRRGRKSSASGALADSKDVQDAAAVESALDMAPLQSRKARRGRKSQVDAALDPKQEEAKTDEQDAQDQAEGSSVTPHASKAESQVSQQDDVEHGDHSASEAQQNGKAKRGGRGGKKRKQKPEEDSSISAEAAAPAAEKVPKVDQQESVKSPPRRSGRSQRGALAQSPSPSKAPSRKSPKRKVLKLN
ncbi:conserved hypothetical protein [Sporisorium reilianum SRZ2]|uniref:Uncharacterized protein n=1 Tax=Sporisorium reilianum (strain SRZ2) TaxID=999809 RepID=E6ZLC2_SPORE|nr:conserved hypothetical protein [Sporisorium reilianum SRZ2]